MPTGRVAFFNAAKGYGFISPDSGESDCFVHADALGASGLTILIAGQAVAYEVLTARNGKRSAVNLSVLG